MTSLKNLTMVKQKIVARGHIKNPVVVDKNHKIKQTSYNRNGIG